MVAILSAVALIFVFRFRSRAALELKLIALQHQLAVLRRQRPGRPQLSSLDQLLWVLLYRIWPQVIDAMVLVKPATVVEWHRRGFRLYWRWRSRAPGRPKISPDIRDLIRRMSRANPLWGAPRIHGELLKLGINVSQATVGRWMLIAIAGVAYLIVLWVRGTRPILRVMIMKGKWGLAAVPCPRCGSPLPRLHTPKPLNQGGGFFCPNCGREADRGWTRGCNLTRLCERRCAATANMGSPTPHEQRRAPP